MSRNSLDDDDTRDRTAFVEYFKSWNACLTSVWHEDGKLDYFVVARID